jgi:hypothetical protein
MTVVRRDYRRKAFQYVDWIRLPQCAVFRDGLPQIFELDTSAEFSMTPIQAVRYCEEFHTTQSNAAVRNLGSVNRFQVVRELG